MGQVLELLREQEDHNCRNETSDTNPRQSRNKITTFPCLTNLPPELSFIILSNLNATDLCLAGCVWDGLCRDEVLWHGLCKSTWPYCEAYKRTYRDAGFSYRQLYLMLDEAIVIFNGDPSEGMSYLIRHNLIKDAPEEIAKFLHNAKFIYWKARREYLESRRDVLDRLIELQNFEKQFLPNALRKFFGEIHAPSERGNYLHFIIDRFSERFVSCNPALGLDKDAVYVACFSLIMLSVDLCSPHVKNKMSKREFIRNTRRAAQGINDDFAGHLYDNVYLIGHVAPQA